MTVGIGHNSGRVIKAGYGWRKHIRTLFRKEILPRLPIEVVCRRVIRAKELRLPYQIYTGLRASNEHHLIGFMFLTNTSCLFRDGAEIPKNQKDHLEELIRCFRFGLVHKPVRASALAAPIDGGFCSADAVS